jgi:hypothetical protein
MTQHDRLTQYSRTKERIAEADKHCACDGMSKTCRRRFRSQLSSHECEKNVCMYICMYICCVHLGRGGLFFHSFIFFGPTLSCLYKTHQKPDRGSVNSKRTTQFGRRSSILRNEQNSFCFT